jgi:hypothetical protein
MASWVLQIGEMQGGLGALPCAFTALPPLPRSDTSITRLPNEVHLHIAERVLMLTTSEVFEVAAYGTPRGFFCIATTAVAVPARASAYREQRLTWRGMWGLWGVLHEPISQ